jgi:ABC-type dipeptide/oligopeptide/nickel transport system permease subunit
VVGGALVALLVVVAALAPVIAPYDPRALSGGSLERPSAEHLLGTNDIGQDIFSQIVWGARPALVVPVAASTLTMLVGLAVGLGAALRGGWADTVAMRVVDVFLAVPQLPLLVLIAALAGPSQANLVLVIGLIRWPAMARMVRSSALSLRQRGFVGSARGFGGGPAYVVRRHLVPAIGPLVALLFVAGIAHTLLLEASLAFLGLSDPTAVSWGLVLNRALALPGLYFTSIWIWWVLPAGLAITGGVLGFMILGVGLEPVFNPRWERAA